MHASLPRHEIVLLGAGHTNAHVLRMWRMQPLPDARLTCVTDFPVATYSGMLPGTLAGLYPPERMEIDLVRLCAAVGARYVRATVTGLDLARRELQCDERPPLPFDVLSIGIGSVPDLTGAESAGAALVPIKPMQTFLDRLEARLADVGARLEGRPLRALVVGGGVGGTEIALCLEPRIRSVLGDVPTEVTLVTSDDDVGHGLPAATVATVRAALEAKGVRLETGRRATGVGDGRLEFAEGDSLPADVVLWATSARPPALVARLGLPTDEAGFLRTRRTLQTVADAPGVPSDGAPVFVVGDTGSIEGEPLPKAGVYAVRQGPIVWENIRRTLRGESLLEYNAQRGFLKLVNTGDGKAILSYKGRTAHAGWCWRLKDWIDGRFMDKYQDYRPMEMAPAPAERNGAAAMRCAGCGGKVGAGVLSRVLARLEIPPAEHVLVGLDRPDDAAVVVSPGGGPVTVTTDFFAAPLDDPWLVGRIAALNAASDVLALGARPHSALALSVVPPGPADRQEQALYEMLSGAVAEFRRMGTALVGGHTIEGPELLVGFTVLGATADGAPRTKGALRAGDRLLLTKPLGTGVLLRAAMQAECRAAWMEGLVAAMLTSNLAAAELLDEFDVRGVTDVTGFGLAGHLLEMLRAADLAAELDLGIVPLLDGARELLAEGVESTLAPQNRAVEAEIDASEAARRRPAFAALFDPQTSGGMLLGVAEDRVEGVLARLAESSDLPAAVVGVVVEPRDGKGRVVVE